MILVRDVFQAKYGRGDEVMELFKEARQTWPQYTVRTITDASGPFLTVVTEVVHESLAAWERGMSEVFAHPGFEEWFTRMVPLVGSSRREFYNIE